MLSLYGSGFSFQSYGWLVLKFIHHIFVLQDVTLEPTTSFYTGETFKGYNNDKTCVAEPQVSCWPAGELPDKGYDKRVFG